MPLARRAAVWALIVQRGARCRLLAAQPSCPRRMPLARRRARADAGREGGLAKPLVRRAALWVVSPAAGLSRAGWSGGRARRAACWLHGRLALLACLWLVVGRARMRVERAGSPSLWCAARPSPSSALPLARRTQWYDVRTLVRSAGLPCQWAGGTPVSPAPLAPRPACPAAGRAHAGRADGLAVRGEAQSPAFRGSCSSCAALGPRARVLAPRVCWSCARAGGVRAGFGLAVLLCSCRPFASWPSRPLRVASGIRPAASSCVRAGPGRTLVVRAHARRARLMGLLVQAGRRATLRVVLRSGEHGRDKLEPRVLAVLASSCRPFPCPSCPPVRRAGCLSASCRAPGPPRRWLWSAWGVDLAPPLAARLAPHLLPLPLAPLCPAHSRSRGNTTHLV